MGAALAKVGKQILAILLGDKKGRKTLAYIVGIALFIVLLPLIVSIGLFGWMSNNVEGSIIDKQMVYDNIPEEYRVKFEEYEVELSCIETIFEKNNLETKDISVAKTIYVSCLTNCKTDESFYLKYADCFKTAENIDILLDKISSAFGVKFSDADKKTLCEIYGGNCEG